MRLSSVFQGLVCAAVLAGCPGPSGFEDHTRSALASEAAFEALATSQNGRSTAKFIISGFGSDAEAVRYLDSGFYTLHDEWYWFRLLNGERIPGREGIEPFTGGRFDSIASIYAWARAQGTLPLDLGWVSGDRLYSPRFYELALTLRPRALGLGTLIHVAASDSRPERWAFQLEFTDAITHAELVRFFGQLERSLPAEVAPKVVWVVRSQAQEQVARDIEAQRLRYFDRIIRMKDLTAPGEVEVYNDGLTAGRLLLVKAGASLEGTTAQDVLVMEEVPDVLPPAAGVITAVPQTPLAHFNLLAKNRGIPNAYRAGALDETELRDLATWRVPVVVQTVAPAKVVIKPISEAQYAQWLQTQRKPHVAVAQVDVSQLAYVYDLKALRAEDSDAWRPALGGKATGYLGLLAGAPEATPDAVAALSIRAYAEHVAPFRARLAAMLLAADFNDVRVRALVLDGPTRFLETHRAPADATYPQAFLASHPPGDVLGDLVRDGGVRSLIRDTPLAPATLGAITSELQRLFGHYAVTQGLRFRSSSTAEDVEGFNGAGLYDSNTGYLQAAAQGDPDLQKRTVEWAVKKTWASYWSPEAFEERALENVDHLSGHMAVVVHAKFDDDQEVSNGVFLFTVHDGDATMDLNVQVGAVSVTNPTQTALPEVVRVTLPRGTTTPHIERLRASTLAPAGAVVLSDDALRETFSRGLAVTTRWLERENSARPEAQRAKTQVLDFEFRQVPAGWPALQSGTLPARIVLKQSRSLEPAVRGLSPDVLALPLPHDVLHRARRIERRTCTTADFTAQVVEAFTNPLAAPDLGFNTAPFTASVDLTFLRPVPTLQLTAGQQVRLTHLSLHDVQHEELPQRWSLSASIAPPQPLSAISLREGAFTLTAGSATVTGDAVRCTTTVLHASPTEFLLSLL